MYGALDFEDSVPGLGKKELVLLDDIDFVSSSVIVIVKGDSWSFSMILTSGFSV